MLTEHPDAQLIALGIDYERFASDCDKLNEKPPSDFEELVREEERLSEEGHRLRVELTSRTAKTLEGVAVQLRAIGHCNRWGETSSAERARQEGATAEGSAWQVIAALPAILDQLRQGGKVPSGLTSARGRS